MARRKKTPTPKPPVEDVAPPIVWDSQVFTGRRETAQCTTSVPHSKRARDARPQRDLDERAKEAILVAMNCPCCGAGGMNYTAKIKRKPK